MLYSEQTTLLNTILGVNHIKPTQKRTNTTQQGCALGNMTEQKDTNCKANGGDWMAGYKINDITT